MRRAHHAPLPLWRYGDIVGRASAGLIIAATASFAVAAVVADLL